MTDAAALIAKLRRRLERPPTDEAEGVKLLGVLDQLIDASSDDERRWFQEAKGRYLLDFPFGDPMLVAELANEALADALEDLSEADLAAKHDTCRQIAVAFHLRRAGTARANLESAIHWAAQALTGAGEKGDLLAQGEAHLLLGELYISRLAGERVLNLETSGQHYLSASRLFDRNEQPNGWCRAQLGLANVLAKPALRDRTRRLRQSISTLEDITDHLETQTDPVLELQAYMQLGVALAQYPAGDDVSYNQRAIRAFRAAARLSLDQGQLSSWAQAQHNLGNAYLDCHAGRFTMNRARAIVHYRRALDVRRDEGNSHRLAQTLNALGTAYWELRDTGDRYLGLAREALEEVTELRLRLGRLDEALGSAQNLSRVLAAQSAWPEILTLGERLFFDNDLRLKDTSTPAEAERLVSAFGRLVDMMALAASEHDGPKACIDVLLRGRARLGALREGGDDENSDRMREVAPDELLVVTLVPIPPNPIQLIMIYRDPGGVLRHQTERLDGFSQYDLDEMIYGEAEDALSWIHAYQDVHVKNDRTRLAEMLDVIGDRLGQEFSSVGALLDTNPHLQHLTWAPSGALSVLPLGRCRFGGQKPMNERLPCRVATSLRAYPEPTRKIGQGRVISFSDPEGNLPFGRIEGDVLKEQFPETE
ncbi:MAG: tetratricopeptide repeat protein, partial [Pseudomonadota bacterium]